VRGGSGVTTVLVTGANGFIGARLCRFLAGREYRVRALVRATSDLSALAGAEVELIRGDITDPASLIPALTGVERVIHLAGVTRARNRAAYERVNVTGTGNLVQAAAAGDPARLVFVSSLAAAGHARRGSPLTEEDKPRPIGHYGRTKHAAELVCRAVAPADLEIAIIRPAIVYGPWDDDLLTLYRLASRGWVPTVPGDIRASMIHVDDLVDLLERAGRVEAAAGRTYFAAGPEAHPMRHVVRLMAQAQGRRVRFVPVIPHLLYPLALLNELLLVFGIGSRVFRLSRLQDYLHRFWTVDPAAAMRDLQWDPRVGLEQGIAETAAWYTGHGWL